MISVNWTSELKLLHLRTILCLETYLGNSLMRSSVDLIGVVFLGIDSAADAGAGPGSWKVSWMTLTAQFILTTSNLSHNGSPRMAGPGMSATPTGVHWMGLCTRGARLPCARPMKVIQRWVSGYHCRQ